MANTTKVTVSAEVEYCSLCPFGHVTFPMWDKELEEEVSDIVCAKLDGRIVYHDLSWYECASKCTTRVGAVDTPPSCCPFKK